MSEPETIERILTESKRRMVAGIPLLEQGNPQEALVHFDEAEALRDQLPWREDGHYAWLLAAASINRSDALRGVGNPEFLPEAIRCLDRGIEAMGYVPLAENPLYVERVILAWINRGTACGEGGNVEGALAGFAEAEKVAAVWGEEATPKRIFLMAMLRVNRARIMLGTGQSEAGWLDARDAVRILRKLEMTGEVAAAGIKSCSVQCRALAMLLEEPGGVEKVGDWIAEATDSTEEALALVKASGFRDEWVSDLVRYGAKIYRACQPQFLGEFVTEWLAGDGPLAGDGALKREMLDELLLAQVEVEQKVLLFPQDTEFVESQIRILRSLQAGRLGLD